MRKDLAKVLCERERPQSKSKFNKIRKQVDNRYFQDLEAAPTHLSRADIYGYKHSFSENLTPLYGFLRKSVNRKWNDIYSEMSSTFKKDSVINQHIYQHVWDIIEKDCRCDENGNVFFIREHSWNAEGWLPIEESYAELYIHPETGYLLRIDKTSKKKKQEQKEATEKKELATVYHFISDYVRLIKLDGVWYEFKFEKVVTREVHRSIRNYETMQLEVKLVKETSPLHCLAESSINDSFRKQGYEPYLNRMPSRHPLMIVKGRIKFLGFGRFKAPFTEIKATSKRQLNSKEIKKLSLT